MILRGLASRLRQWPEMKAVSRQWPLWTVRQLLMPIHRMPLTLTSRTGVRCALGDDPLDDAVFRHVHGHGASLYFPAVTASGAGEIEGLILDVGAHHGIYAVEALRRYPKCELIAIEPDPIACQMIRVNAALNQVASRIDVVQAGLATSNGMGWLDVSAEGTWGNRTRAAADSDPGSNQASQQPGTAVTLLTLDAILRGRRPAIVKCNAEGAEFALIPQLLALDLTPALIVLMIHPEAGNPGELVDLLRAAGYAVEDADRPPKRHRFHCFAPHS